jgi:hypothetical protein
MKNRLNLKCDDLRVESFETQEMPGLRGMASLVNCPTCTCGNPPLVGVDEAGTCTCCV